jgi:hypothetical protein
VRILAGKDTGDCESQWKDRRHVLAAVDRQIDLVVQQRVLDLFDEEAFPSGLGQRSVLKPVSRRLDDRNLARGAAGFSQEPRDGVSLVERELTAARAESESVGTVHGLDEIEN